MKISRMSTMDEKGQSSTSKLSAKTVVKADIAKTSRKRKYSNESVVCNKRIKKANSVTEQKVSQGNVQKLEEQGEKDKLTSLPHDCKQSTSKASRKTGTDKDTPDEQPQGSNGCVQWENLSP
uniref:Uncharacterized protein n=1 Tax=Timema bartmani TaxID=61472 RepID=A0A7R9I640_9NEOP|nr:unnamed protein product [Timema bartmani]